MKRFSICTDFKTVRPVSADEVKAIMMSRKTAEICDEIAVLQASTEPDKKEEIARLKKGLTTICFQGRFSGGVRKNDDAEPTGEAILDIDHLESPRIWWQDFLKNLDNQGNTLQQFCDKNYIDVIHVTPSGQGLRFVFRLFEGETIPQGQERMAHLMGFPTWDSCTKDLARLSFLPCWKYVLFFREESFDTETAGPVPSAPSRATAHPAAQATDPTNVSESGVAKTTPLALGEGQCERYYHSIPVSTIIDKLLLIHGGTPEEGDRNNTYYDLCLDARYINDFRPESLVGVLPDFGLTMEERLKTAKSACEARRRQNLPTSLTRAIAYAKQDSGIEKQEEDSIAPRAFLNTFPQCSRPCSVT